jgi:8-oxo-dGTP pyrophosphatase MutT (NUDIX family)
VIASPADLLAVLVDHAPINVRESDSLIRIRAALSWLRDPFAEDADPWHVTASAILVDQDRRVLLHRHKALDTWMQPGGHLDPGETPGEAVVREVAEETGLTATHCSDTPFHVDVHEGPRGHVHLDIRWLLESDGAAPLQPGPGESPDVAWFDLADALELADASLRGALQRLGNGHQTAR